MYAFSAMTERIPHKCALNELLRSLFVWIMFALKSREKRIPREKVLIENYDRHFAVFHFSVSIRSALFALYTCAFMCSNYDRFIAPLLVFIIPNTIQ